VLEFDKVYQTKMSIYLLSTLLLICLIPSKLINYILFIDLGGHHLYHRPRLLTYAFTFVATILSNQKVEVTI